MTRRRPSNIAASVAERLLQRTRRTGEDHQLLLARYALERLMYRLSQSPEKNRFVVIGALLFLVWTGEPFRATRDLDLLALREPSPTELLQLFHSLCHAVVEDDGLVFEPATIGVDEIREDRQYGGLRVTLRTRLGKILIPIQVDIGFGDVVTPKPQTGVFPVLLDFPAPVLQLYPRETVISEKLEAMQQFGLLNSRMKDYYDIWMLARHYDFNGELLRQAIVNTFHRRKTAFPVSGLDGLSDAYANAPARHVQWTAFIRRSHLLETEQDFKVLVKVLREFLMPVIEAAKLGKKFDTYWLTGGPWRTVSPT